MLILNILTLKAKLMLQIKGSMLRAIIIKYIMHHTDAATETSKQSSNLSKILKVEYNDVLIPCNDALIP